MDRDISSEQAVQTNWNQGGICLDELLKSLHLDSEGHALIGANLCVDVLWNYRALTEYRKKRIKEQSISINKHLNFLKRLLDETIIK